MTHLNDTASDGRKRAFRNRLFHAASWLLLVVGLFGAGVAVGYWALSESSNPGLARADVLPVGPRATLAVTTPNVNSGTVAITFPQVSTIAGVAVPAANYRVARYAAAGGAGQVVTADCSGAGVITCTIGNAPQGNQPDGVWQYKLTVVYGTNWAGTEGDLSPVVVVDTVGPESVVGYPVTSTTYGPNWLGAITGTATDNESLIDSIGVSVKDLTTGLWWNGSGFTADVQTFNTALGTLSWSYLLSYQAFTDVHQYAVVTRAVDAKGNASLGTTTSFTLDTASPSVSITYPVDGAVYGPNWTGTISGTASDPVGNLGSVTLQIVDSAGKWWNGSSWQGTMATVAAVLAGSNWSYGFSQANLTDEHQYSVSAVAFDAVGNDSGLQLKSFTVDLAALPVAVTAPTNGSTSGVNWSGFVAGTAGQPFGNLAAVSLTIADTTNSTWWNGTSWGSVASVSVGDAATWSYPFAAAHLTSGHAYSVIAVGIDAVGNTGTSSVVSFAYNTAAPILTVSYPANATYGINWSGSVTGFASASAPMSIETVTLTIENTTLSKYWNGVAWQSGAITVPASGTLSWTYEGLQLFQLTSGSDYSIVGRGVDSGGNLGSSSAATFRFDTAAPSVNITYPTNLSVYGINWGDEISGTTQPGSDNVTVAAGATSVAIQDTTTGKWWNGIDFTGSNPAFLPASGSTSWSYPLADSALTTMHTYAVHVQATDNVSNVGVGIVKTFTFDTTSPTVSVTYPVDTAIYGTNWSGVFSGVAAADGQLTPTKVSLVIQNLSNSKYWDGSAWQDGLIGVSALGTLAWTYPMSASHLSGGTSYAVVATVTDNGGNMGGSTSHGWTYTSTPPAISISYPDDQAIYGASWLGTLSGLAGTEPGVSIATISLSIHDVTAGKYWNGVTWQDPVTTVAASGDPLTMWTYGLTSANLTGLHAYSVTATATDSAGGSSSTTKAFSFDVTVPALAITYPDSGTTYGANWAGLLQGSATATMGLNVIVVDLRIEDTTDTSWWNGFSWTAENSIAAVGTTTWAYTLPNAALTNGHSYAVTATATDSGSNTSTTAKAFAFDSTPPSASVVSPTSATGYSTDWSGALVGIASAHGVLLVDTVTLTIEDTSAAQWWSGVAWQGTLTSVLATGSTNWSYALALAALPDAHGFAVTATAVDSAGNTYTTSPTTFTIDKSLPSVVITYPVDASKYGPNWAGTITGTTADLSSNVVSVALRISDDTSGSWWNGTTWQATLASVSATGTTTWSYDFGIGQLTDTHHYSVAVLAADAVANVGIGTASFTVDVATLDAAVTYPSSTMTYGANWTGLLAGTAGDVSGDLASVSLTIRDTTSATLYWNGSTWLGVASSVQASSATSWTYTLSSSHLTNGHTYSMVATASDVVGNTGSTSSVTWRYTTTAPTVAMTYPTSATTYGANWTASLAGTSNAGTGLSISGVSLTIRNASTATYWNGAAWQSGVTTVPATGTTAWAYFGLTAINLTSGNSYSVVATATDSGANVGSSSTVNFGYNTQPPSVSVTYPLTGSTFGSNWAGSVSGTSAAASGLSISSGATSVAILDATTGKWWNGSNFTTATNEIFLPSSGSTSWSYALASSNLTSGDTYTVIARVTDSAGNVATGPTAFFSYLLASKLVFSIGPTASVAGVMMVPVVRVSVTDAAGHVATADNSTSVTVAIGVNPGTGALTGGTPVTVVNGVASYAGLSINRVGIGYTLTARGGSLTAATSGVFNISVGPAFKVAFTTQPSATATGGTAFAVQPVVTVQDFSGNRVTTDASSISLTASAGAGDVVSCTANPLNASSGIATFANCRINTASATPYLLTAAGGGLITAVSTGVTVSVGSATKLAFSTQPSAIAVRGVAFASQPVVKVQDAGGNTVTASSSSILLTPSGGTLTCSNSNSRTAVAGSATWAGCSFSTTGTRTLGASSAGLASATSASIVVGNPQVAAPTGVTSVAGTQNNRTTVVFTASSPATGVASYSCSVYKNTGRTSTPVRGLLILSAACRAGNNNSINLRTGGADTGTNTIVVVVRAVPAVNYLENFSTDIVGSVG